MFKATLTGRCDDFPTRFVLTRSFDRIQVTSLIFSFYLHVAVTSLQSGFLILIQSCDRPDRYGEPTRLHTLAQVLIIGPKTVHDERIRSSRPTSRTSRPCVQWTWATTTGGRREHAHKRGCGRA